MKDKAAHHTERVLHAGLFQLHAAEELQQQHETSVAKNLTCLDFAGQAVFAQMEEEQQNVAFTQDETLLVFDYDDTLLPSTWLQRNLLGLGSQSVVSPWQKEQLQNVENTAIELIRNAKLHGTVVLVTNAQRGWIELSCQKFLPGLWPLLEDVKAVSARTAFESFNVTSPFEWKLRAFEHEICNVYSKEGLRSSCKRKNVVSFGDSVHERNALLQATRTLPNCCPKSIKFVDRPELSQITEQHTMVNACFRRIVHHEGLLDLCLKLT